MRYLFCLAVLSLVTFTSGPALAELANTGPCAQKEQEIAQKLEIAKKNNTEKVLGLEQALTNVRAWCSDGGLLSKIDRKIKKKREKVRDREDELAEAIAEDKGAKKIAQRKRKLDEAKDELDEVTKERADLLKSVDSVGK